MTKSSKPFVFVLMPFSDAFDDTYQLGIKAAAEAAGADVARVDEQVFQESIVTRIYSEITRADLIVADLSEHNPNVFYEVGYAHALGKKLILLTRTSETIPFDLKNYPHVVYGDRIVDLRSQLERRVRYFLDEQSQAAGESGADAANIAGEYLADGNPNYRVTVRRLSSHVYETSNPTWSGAGIVVGSEYYGIYRYGDTAFPESFRNTWGVHRATYDPGTKALSIRLLQVSLGMHEWESGRWIRDEATSRR